MSHIVVPIIDWIQLSIAWKISGGRKMRTISARIREELLDPLVEKSRLIYDAPNADIPRHQLNRFNALWFWIQRNVPYYRDLVQDGIVPSEINSVDDFERLPILTRTAMQEDVKRYIDNSHKITKWSTTGGSTGTPFSVPCSESEGRSLMPNPWMGRGFYGIRVSDRMFHLWGHSHLFGSGWKRYVKQAQRKLKNWMLGYRVFSAYHLTPERLRDAGRAIIKMRPDYVIGYSRSLAQLAKANCDQAKGFSELSIKAIIGTTEAFVDPNDASLIAQVFGCPVGMEYGAAETGIIAYTHPSDNRYRVFWDTYLLEALPTSDNNAKLLLTALYPRALPLIRYDIGDSVRGYEAIGNSVISFNSVLGRDNDLVEIGNGAFVHPVALIHCIQYFQGVLGVQVVQEKDSIVSMNIMCKVPLPKQDEAAIRRNLSTLNVHLGECRIEYVQQLDQTIAGKTKWIVRR